MTITEEKKFLKEQVKTAELFGADLDEVIDAIDEGNYYYTEGDFADLGEYMWDYDIMELANKDIEQQLKFVESCIDYEELGKKFFELREMIELPDGGFLELM